MKDGAIDDLFGDLYSELHRLATSALRSQRSSHTLQPTALVNEVWLKVSRAGTEANDRGHFLATAARAMRQVLQDHARAHRTEKRGQSAPVIQLDASSAVSADDLPSQEGGFDLLVFDDALGILAELNPRQAEIAQLRILGGLTLPEVSAELDLSERTVQSDWVFARAWLRVKLAPE